MENRRAIRFYYSWIIKASPRITRLTQLKENKPFHQLFWMSEQLVNHLCYEIPPLPMGLIHDVRHERYCRKNGAQRKR